MESQATNYGEVGAGGGLRGARGVIRFLANYSRVPLTSPICLDYPDGPSEPRDLKARSPPAAASPRPFLRSPFAPVTSAHAKKRARRPVKLIFVKREQAVKVGRGVDGGLID